MYCHLDKADPSIASALNEMANICFIIDIKSNQSSQIILWGINIRQILRHGQVHDYSEGSRKNKKNNRNSNSNRVCQFIYFLT